jgi:Na+-transporting NADH:ubiquinone oxidoreductase subunit NqrC
MDLNKFKELEQTIKGENFSNEYKNINWVMLGLSLFGNVASIFLAYFLLSKILSAAIIDNPVLVTISSIILLSGLELLKRDVFQKLSTKIISNNGFNKTLAPLLAVAIIVVSFSFYATISGAGEFSSKSEEIEKVAQVDTKKYADSLTNVYNLKIGEKENELKEIKSKIDSKDAEQTSLEAVQPLTPAQRSRVRDLKAEKDILREEAKMADTSVAVLKRELNIAIKDYEAKISQDANKAKDENKSNTFLFVMISSLIEIIILAGVYFNRYYKIRTYREFKQKLDKDPNFQKWILYDSILDLIYNPDTKINDKLPSTKNIAELMKLNGTNMLPRDVTDFVKVLSSLSILRTSGGSKYIGKSKETAKEILKTHFNIK